MPAGSPYCGAKAALSTMVNCLQMEVAHLGIRCLCVEARAFPDSRPQSCCRERQSYFYFQIRGLCWSGGSGPGDTSKLGRQPARRPEKCGRAHD
jgi:NAD(P)-dependent dehydrogenase (short-subunit alcohol dehydrogenase family)